MNKAGLQRLELADDLFPQVMRGAKTDILHWKEENIGLGYLEFYSVKNPALTATVLVTGVQKNTLQKFASRCRMTVDGLLLEMKRHYPDITPQAQMQLVEFMTPDETAALTS